ncbi:MAG: hypothetical protein ACOC80_11045 [Petrotogales bacterium]
MSNDGKTLVSTEPKKKPNPTKVKKNLRYQRDKDRELVKGIFRFYEVPGGTLSFPFRKYAEDNVEQYDLEDGKIYTLPLGVAKHLNNNCWYPVHNHLLNEDGKPSKVVGKKVHRCAFQSLEFIDIDEMNNRGEKEIEEVFVENDKNSE